MRDVLVDYLRERQPSVDFSSLQRDAYLLGKLFWADLEAHHPGIDSMKLPRDVAAAWKQRVMTKTRTTTTGDGGPPTQVVSARLDGRSVMTAVRAFYLDIAEWADDDPARWAPWAVRCPVSATDVSHKKDRSQRKSRMDQRTRERLPVLPALTAWVEGERARTSAVLHAARTATPGELFTAGDTTLRRSILKTPTTGRIWAEHPDSGQRHDVSFDEHRGFWTWAMVEVLRHTGIRIEELTELSHHSLIQYRLPATGELIPLLQITPSKTDQERLLVISPELADVLSAIIGRIRGDEPDVPLVVSYDKNERVYNPPMPLLFQFHRRLETRAVSETSLRHYLDHALTATGITDRSGSQLRYTFHDFRRLFITDAIMHGMPPHIAQLVAGHRDINTTMGYKAVYPEEVINGHRAFIARRRAQRPSEEYRTPSDEEWAEFLGHFERRKVAVGDCGRSYATPCIHEHSCLSELILVRILVGSIPAVTVGHGEESWWLATFGRVVMFMLDRFGPVDSPATTGFCSDRRSGPVSHSAGPGRVSSSVWAVGSTVPTVERKPGIPRCVLLFAAADKRIAASFWFAAARVVSIAATSPSQPWSLASWSRSTRLARISSSRGSCVGSTRSKGHLTQAFSCAHGVPKSRPQLPRATFRSSKWARNSSHSWVLMSRYSSLGRSDRRRAMKAR